MNITDKVSIIHGECIEKMSTFPEKSIDMVICDLPYGEVNRKSGGLRNLDKGKADICLIDFKELIKQYGRICKGTVYLFCGIKQISELTLLLEQSKFSTRLGQWEKTNPSPMNGSKVWLSGSEFCVIGRKAGSKFNRHCEKPIWKYPVGQNKIHPTQKPVKLFEYLIESSSDEGDLVLDNCMGSGTTGIACINLNRRFIGIEQDVKYFEVAKQRIIDNIVL